MHEAEVGLTSLGLMPQESPDFSPGRRSRLIPGQGCFNPRLREGGDSSEENVSVTCDRALNSANLYRSLAGCLLCFTVCSWFACSCVTANRAVILCLL